MTNCKYLIIILYANLYFICHAQTLHRPIAETIIEDALTFADNYPNEKVYLHFDNNSYYLGETLWFKAHVVTNGLRKKAVSKVLYVELWNQFGQKVEEQIYQVENGGACGQLKLKKEMLPGYYEVRAYTRWMRNWGNLNYFSRVFPFYASPSVAGEYKKELFNFHLEHAMKERPVNAYKEMDISFFPEGGNLVQGVSSKVAFRVRAAKEPFPDVSLKVYSANDELLDTCSVIHDGMGWFNYRPSEKKGYVKLEYKGKEYKYRLPDSEKSGICLSLRSLTPDSLFYCLNRDSETRVDTLIACLVANCRPYHAINIITNDKEVLLDFPLNELPGGVAQLLLMAPSGKMLCERMFFVNRKENYVNMRVDGYTGIFLPHEKISLKLKVSGADNHPVSTDVSLAVRSVMNSDLQRKTDNIRTNLLLSSELRGYIHRPEYYFLPDGNVRSKELDLLLAVQGWKKYNWENLFFPPTPSFLPELSLQLAGRLKLMWNGRYLPNAEVSIMIRDSAVAMGSLHTDSMGNFTFPLPYLSGRKEVILQSRAGKNNSKKKCYFLLDRHFTPPLKAYEQEELLPLWDSLPAPEHLSKVKKELMGDDYSIWLDEVLIKKRSNKLPLMEYSRSIAAVIDVERLVEDDLDKGKRYRSLYEFLKERGFSIYWNRPKGINVDKNDIQVAEDDNDREKEQRWRQVNRQMQNDSEYLYQGKSIIPIVNGRAVINPSFIRQVFSEVEGIRSVTFCVGSSLDKYLAKALSEREATDVDGVDWNAQTIGTERMVDAIIDKETGYVKFAPEDNLTNRVGSDYMNQRISLMIVETKPEIDYHLGHKMTRGLRQTYIQGYTQPESFYSPDYSNSVLSEPNDHRRTLYWNPNLRTNENGEVEVFFYNNQDYTILNVNAETITHDGRFGVFNQ